MLERRKLELERREFRDLHGPRACSCRAFVPDDGSGVFNNWYPRYNVDDLLLYLYGSRIPRHCRQQRQRSGDGLPGARPESALFILTVPVTLWPARCNRNGEGSSRSHRRLRQLGLHSAAWRCGSHSRHRRGERQRRYTDEPRSAVHVRKCFQRGLAGRQPDLHSGVVAWDV